MLKTKSSGAANLGRSRHDCPPHGELSTVPQAKSHDSSNRLGRRPR